MERTSNNIYLQRDFVGYVLTSGFSVKSQQEIAALQRRYIQEFGNAIHPMSLDSLHITLMDWLAPLVDYPEDKDKLFNELFEEYDKAFTESIQKIGAIEVEFGSVNISPEAIFLIGQDKGQYQGIRQRFLRKVSLLPNTKQPPKIVHTTVARFREEAPLQPIQDFTANQSITFKQTIDSFRLRRITNKGVKTLKVYETK